MAPKITPVTNNNIIPPAEIPPPPLEVGNANVFIKPSKRTLKTLEAGKNPPVVTKKAKPTENLSAIVKKTKVKPKSGRMVALATNSIYEISKAFNQDRTQGTITATPRALFTELLGWGGAFVGSAFSLVATRNPQIAELSALSGYAMGSNIGSTFFEDQAAFHESAFNNIRPGWEFFGEQMKRAAIVGVLGPFMGALAGPGVYQRLTE